MSRESGMKQPKPKTSVQSGGILLKGTQTHESRKRPDPRLDRKRWKAGREGD